MRICLHIFYLSFNKWWTTSSPNSINFLGDLGQATWLLWTLLSSLVKERDIIRWALKSFLAQNFIKIHVNYSHWDFTVVAVTCLWFSQYQFKGNYDLKKKSQKAVLLTLGKPDLVIHLIHAIPHETRGRGKKSGWVIKIKRVPSWLPCARHRFMCFTSIYLFNLLNKAVNHVLVLSRFTGRETEGRSEIARSWNW